MDAQNRRNPQQHIHIERDGLVLAHPLAPVVIGGSGRKAQDQKALFFRQAPEVRDRQEGPQSGRAETAAVGRCEPGHVEPLKAISFTKGPLLLISHLRLHSKYRYSTYLDKSQLC